MPLQGGKVRCVPTRGGERSCCRIIIALIEEVRDDGRRT